MTNEGKYRLRDRSDTKKGSTILPTESTQGYNTAIWASRHYRTIALC